jgi:hypothetical protein
VVEILDSKAIDIAASGSRHHPIIDPVILQQEGVMLADSGKLFRREKAQLVLDKGRLTAGCMAQ